MKSLIKKVLISFIVLIILLLSVVQFPSLFVEKKFDYNQFALYSNDGLELTESVKNALDSVQSNLEQSKFHRENLKLDLYLSLIHI